MSAVKSMASCAIRKTTRYRRLLGTAKRFCHLRIAINESAQKQLRTSRGVVDLYLEFISENECSVPADNAFARRARDNIGERSIDKSIDRQSVSSARKTPSMNPVKNRIRIGNRLFCPRTAGEGISY